MPSSAQNGATFGTAPVVQLRDNLDNPVALADVDRPIREVVAAELERMPTFRTELILGQHPVY